MFAISSIGQLISTLIMLFAVEQTVLATAPPLDVKGEFVCERLTLYSAGCAVLACTAFVIMRGLGL